MDAGGQMDWKTVRGRLMDGRSDTAPEPLNPGDMH